MQHRRAVPFASFPAALIEQILDVTFEALRPGGTFTTFQYLHATVLPSARFFRERMRQRFGPFVYRAVEFRNTPPAFVFRWRKSGE